MGSTWEESPALPMALPSWLSWDMLDGKETSHHPVLTQRAALQGWRWGEYPCTAGTGACPSSLCRAVGTASGCRLSECSLLAHLIPGKQSVINNLLGEFCLSGCNPITQAADESGFGSSTRNERGFLPALPIYPFHLRSPWRGGWDDGAFTCP